MVRFLAALIFLSFTATVYSQTITPSGSITICPGGSRVLTVTAPSNTTYQWLRGTSPNITPIAGATSNTYAVNSAGTYSVKIGGASKVDTLGPVVVTMATMPVASFNFSPTTTGCGNTPLTFTSTSGTGLTSTWQFDDPRSGANNSVTTASASVIHYFKGNPGNATQTFVVKLVVTNNAGCKDSTTRMVTINQIPGPALNGDGQIAFEGQTYFKQCSTTPSLFTFTNQTVPAINNNYEIIWGDGSPGFNSTSFPASLTHTYNVGNYILQFIVVGVNGCLDTTRYGVFVGNAPNGGIGTENPVLTGCTGTTFNFPFLPGVFTNSIGTYYHVSVDDGTPEIVYSQPPPASYTHTFNKPSCGNGSSSNNYFTVSLVIKNPCNVSGIPGTIGGIKISSTPGANFAVSKDTLCVNQIVTLTDQSINTYVDESGLCTRGKSIWSIAPGVQGIDWAITSGTLGNDNGSSSPSDWTAGTSTLQVRTIKPGSYSIKLKTGGSNQCGIDSISKSICVNPLPNIHFSFSADTVCTSAVDSVIYTPATAFCGKNIFEWSVAYSPAVGCFPATENYRYVDGTGAGSANPHFTFMNPGTYKIKLIAFSPARSCYDQAEKNVVVKGIPYVSLPANMGICQNQPLSLTSAVSCFIGSATYHWLFPGGNIPSSNVANPPPVTYTNAGNYDITLNVTNECGMTTSVEHITVGTLVNANAGPDTTLCGSSIKMAANTPGSATGRWSIVSGPNTPSFTTPSSPATTINGLVPGTYVFKWKISNGGCVDSSTVTVVIVPGPTAANAGPDQLLCLNTNTTLAANTPARGSGIWSFISGPNKPVITSASSPTSTITGLIPGIYVLTWTISFSNCSPSVDTIRIKINDNPTVANAGADQTLCTSSTILTGNTPVIGTGEWSLLSGPNPAVITTPELASTSITGMISGTYYFVWKISNDPCPPGSDTVMVHVSTIASNIIKSDQTVCINTIPAAITGSIPAGGNGNYNYQWQQSSDAGLTWNAIAGAINVDYTPGMLMQSTCFRRIVTTALCPVGDSSNQVCITVSPDANALFTAGKTLLCAPTNIDSLITVTTFPDRNLQYNWYQDNTFITGNTTGLPPSFVINTSGQTVSITLVTTSLFGCRADSMHISFTTLPSVTANFKKDIPSGCGPLGVTFTNTSSILNNSIEYYWDFGNGTKLSNVMQPASPVAYTASPSFNDTTYYITLKAFSGCDTSFMRDSITVFANPKARFTSKETGCSPFRDTILNNSFGQDASTRYYWDFGDNKRDTTFATGKIYHMYNTGIVDTFTIRLIAENRCGRDTQTMNAVVSPNRIQPQVSINGSELYGCAPHTATFQNSSLGASLLYWDFGDSTPIVVSPNGQSVVNHTYVNSGVYAIRVRLENDCTDTSILKQVTVYEPPLASGNIVNSLLCTGNTVYTNNTSANANSYEWFWGDNTSTSAFNTSHVYVNPGTYSIRLVARKVNAFGIVCTDTSFAIPVTVVERIPAVIEVSPGNVCVPYAIHVEAAGAANAGTVDWYFYDSNVSPGVFHVSGPSASYTYNYKGVDSVKLIVVNKAGCSDSTMKVFTIQDTPAADFTPVNVKTCNTDTSVSFNVVPNYTGTDPLTYEWYINDQLSGNSNPFLYRFQAPSGITASNPFTIKVLIRNSFGCGDTSLVGNLTIQTISKQYITVLPSVVQEQPHYTFTFSDTAQGLPNTTYLWRTGDRNGQELPGREITYTYGDTGTYHVKLIIQDYETGCVENDSINVFVLAVPGYLYVPNAFCPGCQKAELRQFLPLGKGLKDYHLVIFNIWGQKVFETTSLDANGVPNEPWNGNWVSGQNTQQGAFSWYIEAHYINGSEWKGMMNPKTGQLQKQGFVSIIR